MSNAAAVKRAELAEAKGDVIDINSSADRSMTDDSLSEALADFKVSCEKDQRDVRDRINQRKRLVVGNPISDASIIRVKDNGKSMEATKKSTSGTIKVQAGEDSLTKVQQSVRILQDYNHDDPILNDAIANVIKHLNVHTRDFDAIIKVYKQRREAGYEAADQLEKAQASLAATLLDIKGCRCDKGGCGSCECSKKDGLRQCNDNCKCDIKFCSRAEGKSGVSMKETDLIERRHTVTNKEKVKKSASSFAAAASSSSHRDRSSSRDRKSRRKNRQRSPTPSETSESESEEESEEESPRHRRRRDSTSSEEEVKKKSSKNHKKEKERKHRH